MGPINALSSSIPVQKVSLHHGVERQAFVGLPGVEELCATLETSCKTRVAEP